MNSTFRANELDILDIDSLLKDDSFCLLEEKLHDDVTNIIQQWKINNHKQDVFDGRTFTRGKRKSVTNLETQMKNSMNNTANNISMKIGGLVTQRQRCYLGDISPPNSVCSSMELNSSDMINSLITSADFSNVSFLGVNKLNDFELSDSIIKDSLSHIQEKETLNESKYSNDLYTSKNLSNLKYKQQSDTTSNSLIKDMKVLDETVILNVQDNTFSFENEDNNKLNKSNSILCETFDIQEEETNTSSCSPNATFVKHQNDFKLNEKIYNTPENITGPLNTTHSLSFIQSTPLTKNISFDFNVSEINFEQINNINEKCNTKTSNTFSVNDDEDILLEEQSINEQNDLEKNISAELLSFERNEEEFNDLFDDIKTNNTNETMKKSLNSIKKRFSNKIEKTNTELHHKKNDIPSVLTEKLLFKRGTLYDNTNYNKLISSNLSDGNYDNYQKLPDPFIKTNNEEILENDRFKTIRINKKLKQDGNCGGGSIDNENESIYFRKNSNSPLTIMNQNQNQNKKILRPNQLNLKDVLQNKLVNKSDIQQIYSETLCKAISASDLETSVCVKKDIAFVKPEIRSPMGTKAKSFHNLATNNFGFSRKTYCQVPTKPQNDNKNFTDEKLFSKIPNPVLNVRPPMVKRTGLIRPSTGIYSQTIVKPENLESKLATNFVNEEKRHTDFDCLKTINNSVNKVLCTKEIENGIKVIPTSNLRGPKQSRIRPKSVYKK